MLIRNKFSKSTLLLVTGLFLATSCTKDSNSIFDPDWQGDVDPVITQVTPDSRAYAGIGSVTPDGLLPVVIEGNNFGSDKSNILVYFGLSRAEILSLTDNRIEVVPPNDPGEERRIRVVKITAENYSEFPEDRDQHYELRSIFVPFPGFEAADEPQSITTGFNGELYAANVLSGVNNGVLTMDLEGERERVVQDANWTYPKIQHGPDQAIYMVRGGNIGDIYRSPADALDDNLLLRMPRPFGGILDIDFDANGWLWAIGSNNLLRVDVSSADNETFAFPGAHRAIRVHDGHIYVASVRAADEISGVWRLPIQADNTPGDPELYVQMPSVNMAVRDIAFTQSDQLILATNTLESVMVYRNNQLEELFPGIIPPGARSFAVSSNDHSQLIISIMGTSIGDVTSTTRVLILEMEQDMAPYYGTYQ